MQAAFDHLTANQARENPKTSKEDSQPDVIDLNDSRKHVRVIVYRHDRVALKQGVQQNDDSGNESEKKDPRGAP
jgi:hypothetical protein